ncbi:MAG: SCO family protein, partial [Planctomycetota bacterium]
MTDSAENTPNQNPSEAQPRPSAATGLRWPWLLGGLACVVGALLMVAMPFVMAARPEPLERYGPAPEFKLVNRFAEPFSAEDLRGKVWVANFMFTRCPGICPVLTRHMGGLQDALRADGLRDSVALVSFSVDPERDTPEVLREYANLHQAEPAFWHLLTGQREPIWRMTKEGFKLHVGEADNPLEPIAHTDKLVLVDQ